MNKKSQPPSNPKASVTDRSAPSNRRNYFRINHDVLFDYRPVDNHSANTADPEEAFEDSATVGLVAELRRLDRDAAQSLKKLADKDRALGDYLQLLTNKIDLIARHTILASAVPDSHAPKRINLSEAGIAFSSDKTFYKGRFLAVRLVFLPSYAPVMAFVEIVRCQNKGDPEAVESGKGEYEIAARFHRLPENEQQELSRQILKAQVAHKRTKSLDNKASRGDK